MKRIVFVSKLKLLATAVEDNANRAPDHGYQEPGNLDEKDASAEKNQKTAED